MVTRLPTHDIIRTSPPHHPPPHRHNPHHSHMDVSVRALPPTPVVIDIVRPIRPYAAHLAHPSITRRTLHTLVSPRRSNLVTKRPSSPADVCHTIAFRVRITTPAECQHKATTIRIGALAKYIYRCCLLYTSPSPRDRQKSRMPSSA